MHRLAKVNNGTAIILILFDSRDGGETIEEDDSEPIERDRANGVRTADLHVGEIATHDAYHHAAVGPGGNLAGQAVQIEI